MRFNSELNLFFKENTELTNDEKIEKLKEYSTKDMLTLLRNIEERPEWYNKEIFEGVCDCLYNKGITCIY
jgi:hypothetical protein